MNRAISASRHPVFLPLGTMAFLLFCSISLHAADPDWWRQGPAPAISPSAAPEPKAAANIGQAKWMAKCALTKIREFAPLVANNIEANLVGPGKAIPTWDVPTTPEGKEALKAPLLIGQLKAISAPFYTGLNASAPAWLLSEMQYYNTRVTGTYFPWTPATTDDSNGSMASINQLKAVFSFRFSESLDGDKTPDFMEMLYTGTTSNTIPAGMDTDGDGLPDAWEMAWFGNLDQTASGDPDDDGLTNLQEYSLGTQPNNFDTDGDGLGDGYEQWSSFNPLVIEVDTRGPNADFDGDGVSNKDEAGQGRIATMSNEYFILNPAAPGGMIAKWFGSKGFWYTIQYSTNLVTWVTYQPPFNGQNKELSVDVASWYGAPLPGMLFVRLQIGPGTSDTDADSDGIPDWYESSILGTDPDSSASAGGDTDADGLADGWEKFYFGGLGVANPTAILGGDGLTNKEKSQLGLNPTTNYLSASTAQSSKYSYDHAGRLTGVTGPVAAATYDPDAEGNILSSH